MNSAGLSEKVYSSKGKAVIEVTRVVLDLPALALNLKEHGASPIKVSVTEFPRFKEALSNVPVDSLKDVHNEESMSQFKTFLVRLEALTKVVDTLELCELDSKELIKKCLDPGGKLFKNIEMIMQSLAVCAVKHSCESVLESFVSRYENHFDTRRNTAEDATNQEFEIAVNGSNLANCDAVVVEAMNHYWASKQKWPTGGVGGMGDWHFFRKSLIEKLKTYQGDSEVLDKLMSTKNNLPYMT